MFADVLLKSISPHLCVFTSKNKVLCLHKSLMQLLGASWSSRSLQQLVQTFSFVCPPAQISVTLSRR